MATGRPAHPVALQQELIFSFLTMATSCCHPWHTVTAIGLRTWCGSACVCHRKCDPSCVARLPAWINEWRCVLVSLDCVLHKSSLKCNGECSAQTMTSCVSSVDLDVPMYVHPSERGVGDLLPNFFKLCPGVTACRLTTFYITPLLTLPFLETHTCADTHTYTYTYTLNSVRCFG